MTIHIDEDIFLLYVSVYDIVRMNMLDSKKLMCDEKRENNSFDEELTSSAM